MTFHHPEAWLWALLALPLAMVHLWRPRPRRVPVATGFLWRQALGRDTAAARWLRWRGLASASVDLTALLAIVAAMAEPAGGPAWSIGLVIVALVVLTAQAYLFHRRWLN